jgi:cytoskeletal protein RodZ
MFKRRKIHIKTLGQRLKAARQKKKFKFDEIEEATKIRARYLEAIEADDYRKLPGPAYMVGYLARYANFLNIPASSVVAQYKTEQGLSRGAKKGTHFRHVSELEELRFAVTSRSFIIIVFVLLAVGAFVYIGYQIKKFSAPPPIEIVSPDKDTTDADEIVLQGKTSETAKVTVNNQPVSVDSNGMFSQKLGLSRGVNTIEIKAVNRADRVTVKLLKIFADFAVQANPPN